MAKVMTEEQMTALLVALRLAKFGYTPERTEFYFGVMHGMSHAIDIVERAFQSLDVIEPDHQG
jgi:hypothetical protein